MTRMCHKEGANCINNQNEYSYLSVLLFLSFLFTNPAQQHILPKSFRNKAVRDREPVHFIL